MSLSINFNISGIEGVVSRFNRAIEEVRNFQSTEPKKIANEMIDKMKEKCPVDTGFMRDHISITNSDSMGAQVSSTAEYSKYVEFGTKFMRAQPFFFVIFDEYTTQNIKDDFHSSVTL